MSRRSAQGLLTAAVVVLATLVAVPVAVAADLDCSDFGSQREAQIFFLNHGGPHSDPHRLDSDGDGIACESNPAPYYYGTTPPSSGNPDPQPQPTAVRSSVRITLTPSKLITGESFRIAVSVKPAISRSLVVQKKVGGRWRILATGVTGPNGRTSGSFKAPAAKVAYRAMVKPVTKGNKKYSAATSASRTITVQPQRILLSFDDRTVAEGEQVRALVRATPVRTGRAVVLQQRSSGVWRTVRTSALDRRGRASFTFTPALGTDSYRAVALRHRGAAPVQSRAESVTSRDVTPPPAPYDLIAVPGNGTVALSWSRTATSDFAHHEVWMRTADTPWELVTITEADSAVVSLLPSGVTHWFAVTSVDIHGNTSETTDEVAATPLDSGRGSRRFG